MEIYGPSHVHGPQSISGPHRIQPTEVDTHLDAAPLDGNLPLDRVDISAEADFVSQIHDLPEIRADRVADVRARIEAGVYETDSKLDVAVGRLLDEIG